MPDNVRADLCFHGGARLRLGSASHRLERKIAALLCVLAVDGDTARGTLAAWLWPDVEAAAARRNLRQRIFQLHRVAGRSIVAGTQTLSLVDTVGRDLARHGAEAPAAHETGELLAGLEYAELADFSAWLDALKKRLRDADVEAWSAAASQHEASGELAAAIVLAQRVVAADGLLEHGHRRLMRLHYLRGDSAAAVAAFERCEAALRDELGVRPGAETLALRRTVELATTPALRPIAFVPVAIRRPPRLVGRDDALAELAGAWAGEQAFIVVGEAGIGKSRLLAEHAGRCAGAVTARSRPGDAGVPLALLERLLRTLLDRAPTLGDDAVRDALVPLVPEWAAGRATAAPISSGAIRSALGSLLAAAAAGGLEAILLDDLQFADAQSLDVLDALLELPELAPLRWGFATRPTPSFAAARFGVVVVLPPLAPAAMVQLVASLDIAGVDAEQLAADLSRHTGGNPMFALETLKHPVPPRAGLDPANGHAHARLPRPASVSALIEGRLKSLSPAALALARVAAIATPDFSIVLAEDVLGVRAVALADAWGELESAQMLRGVAFAHDLIYETALATVPAVIATHLHERVARCLELESAEPARIAAHWEEAANPGAAAPQWLLAARAARARGSAVPAAALCERAAAAYDRSGRADAAFDALCSGAEYLSYHGSTEQFGGVVERLVERAHTSAQRARAWFWRAHLDDLRGAPIESVESALHGGLLEAIASEQPTVEAEYRFALGMVARRKGELHSAAEKFAAAATLMESLGMELEAAEVRTILGASMAALGRLKESSNWLQASAPMLEQRGAHNTLGYNHVRRAVNAECAGQGNEAAALQGASIALLNRVDPGAHDWCVIAAPLIESLSAAGHYAQALDLAHSAGRRLRGQNLSRRVMVDVATAHLYLDLGRPEQAMQVARFAGLNLDPASVARAHLFALALEQYGGGARKQIAVDFAAAARVDLRFQLVYALLAATRQEPAEAVRQLSAQIAAAERAGMRGFLPALLASLARRLIASGDAAGSLAAAGRAAAALAKYTPATPPPALFLDLMEAYRGLGLQDDARRAALAGADWLRQRLRSDVPEEFRESIQQRNPVHRALLLAASAALP